MLTVLTVLTMLAPALAHIGLDQPTARYADQKSGPCGAVNDARTGNVTVFEPGETITVEWRETINHPSHYRISFDVDGHDDFVDPPQMYDFYSNDTVLLDDIPDAAGGISVQVTLPNVQCENCTLQVIQVMYDKPPYTIPGNDLYYQCADLALRGDLDTGAPTGTDTDTPPGTTTDPGDTSAATGDTGEAEAKAGCGCAPGGLGGQGVGGLGLALGLAVLRRRRR
jgi:MYXO-CTERM domain-containing protein